MDNTKVSIEVEAGSWLTAIGIETTVYIGDVDMPQVVKTESFEPLIIRRSNRMVLEIRWLVFKKKRYF